MRRSLLAALLVAAGATAAQATDLTVMSFNVWGGGANEQKPVDETVAVIKAVNPDIIGIQETRLESDPCTADVCPAVGDSDALWANAILSRYPIGKATPNDTGVEIMVDGRKVQVFNIHLDDSPYQPYQLLGIEYGDAPFLKTADEAVKAAEATRGAALKLLFDDMAAAGEADAAFVFGDFNEPSHRDWTESAVKAGLQPLVVPFPTVKAIEDKGFVDTFRAIYPDAGAKPGMTWTPTSEPTAKDDHHDRIDFALARAKDLQVISAGIVGEKAPEADIVVTPWPSDHRATMAKVKF